MSGGSRIATWSKNNPGKSQESNVTQASTIIYTHPDCAFSSAAKMDYRKRKVEYTEIDLSKQADQIPALLELTAGERVTPVIVENGVVTIGFKGGT
jgi:glutaredoxin